MLSTKHRSTQNENCCLFACFVFLLWNVNYIVLGQKLNRVGWELMIALISTAGATLASKFLSEYI